MGYPTMSVTVMSFVWKLPIPHDEKFILLAYADHANDDGGSIFPAVLTVAKKTSYSKRSVQEITRKLQKRGLLLSNGKGRHGTNCWCIPLSWDAKSAPVNFSPSLDAETRTARVQTSAPESSLTSIQPSVGGLSEKEIQQANAKVTSIIENQKKFKYANRDKIPETLLPFSDVYNELTGQEPTKRVIQDWLMAFSEWQSEGLRVEHIREAYKYANRPEGGFMVARPGSLTNTAVAMKSKMGIKYKKQEKEVVATNKFIEERIEQQNKFVPMPDSVRERLGKLTKKMEIAK